MVKLYTQGDVERLVGDAVREAVAMVPAAGPADRRVLDAYFRAQTALALARSKAELAELKLDVVRAALEQANEELTHQRNRIEEQARAKGRFFACLAHDLRSPTGAVRGYADLLLQGLAGDVNERQRRYLLNMLAGSDHLLALVDDLLDLATIDAGKLDLCFEPIDVGCLLHLVANLLRLQTKEKSLALTVEAAEGLATLHADELRVRQIVFNLVSNAVKFTPEGGAVRVIAEAPRAAHATLGGAEALEIRVEDTGVGIAAEDLGLVFDEFRRSGDARAGKVKGTGLGLPISRRLARVHGGELWCESALGEGSTFILQIPCRPSAALLAQHGREALEAA